MAKKMYFVGCGAVDEDGPCFIGVSDFEEKSSAEDFSEYVASFLSQTDESYIDDKGFIHEIYEGKDQIFGKYLDDVSEKTAKQVIADLEELKVPSDVIYTIRKDFQKVRKMNSKKGC